MTPESKTDGPQFPGWHPPSTKSKLWAELAIEARNNGWVLQRALNPHAARTRGRYFFRDRFANSIVHGGASLKELRTWLMASPEQRRRTAQLQETTV